MDDLPSELLLDIATYLPLRSLIQLRNTDRRWRAVVSAMAQAGPPESTRRLLQVWITWTTSLSTATVTGQSQSASTSIDSQSSTSTPEEPHSLSQAQRDEYVTKVGRYASFYHGVSHEEPGLSEEFLTWLHEWPAQAGLPLSLTLPPPFLRRTPRRVIASELSPFSLVSSLTSSTSYHLCHPSITAGNGAPPMMYFQDRVIFLIVMEDEDVLLPRIHLHEHFVDAEEDADSQSSTSLSADDHTDSTALSMKQLRCSLLPQDSSYSGFGGDWARFIPISTIRRTNNDSSYSNITDEDIYSDDEDDDMGGTDDKPLLPLYVLSGSGLGASMAGYVCTLGPNAELRVEARSWSEWLMTMASTNTQPVTVPAPAIALSSPQTTTFTSSATLVNTGISPHEPSTSISNSYLEIRHDVHGAPQFNGSSAVEVRQPLQHPQTPNVLDPPAISTVPIKAIKQTAKVVKLCAQVSLQTGTVTDTTNALSSPLPYVIFDSFWDVLASASLIFTIWNLILDFAAYITPSVGELTWEEVSL